MSNEWRRKGNQVVCCGFFGHANRGNKVVTGNEGAPRLVDYWVARAAWPQSVAAGVRRDGFLQDEVYAPQ
jgi:hypothetical protein